MSGNLPLSIHARIDRDITHYERGGERSCTSIAEIMNNLLLELQVRSWDLQHGEDLGVVMISER